MPGVAAEADDLLHREAVDRGMVLAQDADLLGVFHGGNGADVLSLQGYGSLKGDGPAQDVCQGGFTGAVRPDDDPPVAFEERQRSPCFRTGSPANPEPERLPQGFF